MPVTDPATGEVRVERCVRVVDAALAEHARGTTVPEFTRIADRIVQDLDPPGPGDGHRRRYLHLSRLPDGSLLGRFACGPAQALSPPLLRNATAVRWSVRAIPVMCPSPRYRPRSSA